MQSLGRTPLTFWAGIGYIYFLDSQIASFAYVFFGVMVVGLSVCLFVCFLLYLAVSAARKIRSGRLLKISINVVSRKSATLENGREKFSRYTSR